MLKEQKRGHHSHVLRGRETTDMIVAEPGRANQGCKCTHGAAVGVISYAGVSSLAANVK